MCGNLVHCIMSLSFSHFFNDLLKLVRAVSAGSSVVIVFTMSFGASDGAMSDERDDAK